MSQRRKFSAQFKAEAVQLVLQSGRPIAAEPVNLVGSVSCFDR